MASTIALFAQLKSFTYNLNHDIARLKRDAEHQGKASATPPLLSSESDSFINSMACDVESIMGELEQMQADVHYTENKPNSLKNVVKKLRDYHSENENLLNQLQKRVGSFSEKKADKKSVSTKRSAKRSAQQGGGSLLAATTMMKLPSGGSSGAGMEEKKKEERRVSRGRAAPRRALMDLPPPPSPATAAAGTTKGNLGSSRRKQGTPGRLVAVSSSAGKVKRSVKEHKEEYKEENKEKEEGGEELDRSGPLLTIGQIGAIMEGNSPLEVVAPLTLGQEIKDKDKDKDKIKDKIKDEGVDMEEKISKEMAVSPPATATATQAPESYLSPPAPVTSTGRDKKIASPETPETPEIDESLRSAIERINSSSKAQASSTMDDSRLSAGTVMNSSRCFAAASPFMSKKKKKKGTTPFSSKKGKEEEEEEGGDSSFDSEASVDLGLISPPKNFQIQTPGTPTVLFGNFSGVASSSSARNTPLSAKKGEEEEEEEEEEVGEGPDFPVKKVTVLEHSTAPSFITYQTDVPSLNVCVQTINMEVARRRQEAEEKEDDDEDTIPLDDVHQLQAGAGAGAEAKKENDPLALFTEAELTSLIPKKANVLALVTLRRLDMHADQGGTKTYRVTEDR